MKVLVTGGAGYIGSHTVVELCAHGHEVEIVDNFDNSSPEAVRRIEKLTGTTVTCHEVDLRDEARLREIFEAERFDSVIHFAGLKAVGESVRKPLEYYSNNIDGTLALLRVMRDTGVRNLVFSSSATVYGTEAPVPYVEEYEPLSSTSPYGWTKVMIERILTDLAASDPSWRVAMLRYFNPVGAHPSGDIGEDPQGIPNNLTPFIAQVAVGRRERLEIFGDDYPTTDGTCERDYIHVMDLADGHVAALEYLATHEEPLKVWNLGGGHGTSVFEMVAAFGRAVGHPIPYVVGPRREGDLALYWADATRAEQELGWRATRTIDEMCADTWRWQSQNPHGYDA